MTEMKLYYETSANTVKGVLKRFVEEIAEYRELFAKIDLDTRYTPEGKQEFIDSLKKDLNTLCDNYTKTLKTLISGFCDYMKVEFPEDDIDHDAALANALKIIEMMGYNLTPEILREAIDPLKGSAKKIGLIANMIHAKNNGFGDHYDPEILAVLDELVAGFGKFDLPDYLNDYENIHALLDANSLFNYRIFKSGPWVHEIQDDLSYDVLGLSESMIRLGQMYSQFSVDYPQYFTKSMKIKEEK